MEWLEPARLVTASLMLLGAAVSDLRTRRVPNTYWLPFVALAAGFLLWDLATSWRTLAWPFLVACALAVAFYLLWRVGLFGGADSKGLMVLAFLVPRPVTHGLLSLPFAFDALANGALLVLVVPLLLLLWNLAHGRIGLPAILLAVPRPIGDAEAEHVWPMQAIRDGALHWVYWQRLGRDRSSEYAALRAAGLETVWVTPKVPFLAFAAAGGLVGWAWGNLTLLAMQRVFS